MTESARVPQNMEELIDLYDPLICWTINRVSPNLQPEERDDLKQDVYARILQHDFLRTAGTYYQTHPGKFSTSLHRLVRNLAVDRFRREQVRGRSVPVSQGYHVATPSHGRLSRLRRDVALIRKRLPSRPMQEIVDVLVEDPQATSKEIASKLREQGRQIEAPAVRWYLTRIRRMAREISGEQS